MEPGNQYGQQPGSDPASSWSAPAPGYPPPQGAPAAPRARIGVILLTALLVELLLIGGGANQWVSDKIVRETPSGLRSRLLESSWLTFTWRFSPTAGQTQHWAAQLLLVLCVLVVSAALIWCLLRGPLTWGRAFFGTWLAVLGATVVGAVVRGLVDPFAKFTLPRTDRVTRALFGGAGLSQPAMVGAVALGFVVALVTSIVAVVSRRPAVAAPAEQGPPAFPDYAPPPPSPHDAVPPWQEQYGPRAGAPARQPDATTGPSLRKDEPPRREDRGPIEDQPTTHLTPPREPAADGGDQPTTQLPVAPPQREPTGGETPDQPTTQLPAGPPPPAPAAPPAPAGEQSTTRFPRPPDDEELGHIEH